MTENTAQKCLESYCQAVKNRDIDTVESLTGDATLLEHPFFKPARLVGKTEIMKAHRDMFASVDDIEISINDLAEKGGVVISEGTLNFSHNGLKQSLTLGVVLQADETIERLSLYCDARNIRRWSDRTIL